jgi:hypothetical protein
MIDDIVDIKFIGTFVHQGGERMTSLIWAIVVVLFILWLLGFGFGVGGNLIFLLLLLAIAGVLYNVLAGGMYGGSRHHHHTTEVSEIEHHEV